jgi:hypothetical protein
MRAGPVIELAGTYPPKARISLSAAATAAALSERGQEDPGDRAEDDITTGWAVLDGTRAHPRVGVPGSDESAAPVPVEALRRRDRTI